MVTFCGVCCKGGKATEVHTGATVTHNNIDTFPAMLAVQNGTPLPSVAGVDRPNGIPGGAIQNGIILG